MLTHAFGLPFHQDIAVGTDTPIAAPGVNTGAIPTQRSILTAFINVCQTMTILRHKNNKQQQKNQKPQCLKELLNKCLISSLSLCSTFNLCVSLDLNVQISHCCLNHL